MRVLRSVGAVLAGLFTAVILSSATDALLHATGIFPRPGLPMSESLWIFAIVYRAIFAIAGCYLAARLAPSRPMTHAIVLGCIGLTIASLGVLATWNAGPEYGPRWYPISLVITALPCAWIGAKIRS